MGRTAINRIKQESQEAQHLAFQFQRRAHYLMSEGYVDEALLVQEEANYTIEYAEVKAQVAFQLMLKRIAYLKSMNRAFMFLMWIIIGMIIMFVIVEYFFR